jgi:hypothetical protein
MSKDKGYQGWANYETWAYALWLDNEEGSHRHALDLAETCRADAADHPNVPKVWSEPDAARFTLADALKEECEEAMPDLGASPWSDLLNAAVSEIDWNEIAEHYLGTLAEVRS